MSTVDDRIVQMQFDNAQFQSGVADTNKSLNDLQQNLKLDGATSGLNGINDAAGRMNLSSIAQDVGSIQNAFTTLGIIGINILSNITQSAFNAGKRIAGAILDPIVSGGAKRALALEQAKFQFRGLGLNIEKTMKASLDAVLGTAYGLDDAATAAAQFGASGITAGKGLYETLRSIAGVAAQTGSSYSDISRIFIGIAGNGRLMGNDLLSLAGRGVNAAAILAKSMGISEAAVRKLVTEGKIGFKEFRNVMLDTFGKNATKANETFTGALSNMKAALSRIGANSATPYFEALRLVMNGLTPVIDQVAKAIRPLQDVIGNLQIASAQIFLEYLTRLDFSKYAQSSEQFAFAIGNIFKILKKVSLAVFGAFGDIFPAPTVKNVEDFGAALNVFVAKLIPGEKAVKNIRRTVAGFFALISIGIQIVAGAVNMFAKLFGLATTGSDGIGDFTGDIGDMLVALNEAIKKGNGLNTFFETLGGILSGPIGLIKFFFGLLSDGWKFVSKPGPTAFKTYLDDVEGRFSGLVEVGKVFQDFWNGVVDVANAVWNFIKPIFVGIGDLIRGTANELKNVFGELDLGDVITSLNAGFLTAFITAFIGNAQGVLQGQGIPFVSQFNLLFGGLRTNLKALEINTNAKTLTQIAIAVALLAASAVALSLVDSAKLAVSTGVIVAMVITLMEALKVMTSMSTPKGIFGMLVLSVALQAVAAAVLTLAVAVGILALIPLDRLAAGVGAVIIILGAMVGALALLAKIMSTSGPAILAGAGALVLLSNVLVVVAGVVALLGLVPIENLAIGLGAVTAVLTVMISALAVLSKIGPQVIIGALALTLLSYSMLLIAGAIAIMGNTGLDNVISGLVGLAAALTIMIVAMKIMETGVAGAAAMIISALAITLLANALKVVSTMSWDDIGRTMVVLAGSLLILAAAAIAFTYGVVGAAAMLVVAAALTILVPALVALSKMSWEEIGNGLGILAASLGILAVAGILLIPASVGFLLLGAAVLMLGVGVGLAAGGVGTLAVGIAALVAAGSAGIALFTAGIKAFAAQIPMLAVKIGEGMVAMAVTIGESAPELIGAFVKLLLAMIEAVDTVVPQLIKTATKIIVSLVEALVILIPLLVDAGLKIVAGILKGVANNIGQITEQGINIITRFLDAIAKKLPQVITSGGNLVLSFINGISKYIRENTGRFITAGRSLFNAIVEGVARAIEAGGSALRNAGIRIGNALINGARNALGINSPSKEFYKIAGYSIDGITGGMKAGEKQISKAGDSVGKTAINSVQKSLTNMANMVTDTMNVNPTIRPVLDLSAVKKDASQIGSMLGNNTISLDNVKANAATVNTGYEENLRLRTDADGVAAPEGAQINFSQTINSPKAISAAEAYRNTRNLLSVAKEEFKK